jgi:serine phosphatase RsbU (regulator of sigma subunit)
LAELLKDFADLPAEELGKAIFAALTTYQGSVEQYDDMTLLVAEVLEGEHDKNHIFSHG